MKVLLVTPCDLPVPAVNGGAVASLMESILKENEMQKKLNLTVVSSWNKKAEKQSLMYKRTKFIWIKTPLMYQKIDSFLGKLSSPFRENSRSKEYIRKLYVISKLKSILAKKDYDAVVIQNSGYLLKVFRDTDLLEKYKGKIYYHLHNDIPMNADDEVLKQTKFLLISRYLLKKLKEKCGEDVENRCYIVKNGICCEKFRKTLTEKEKLSLRNKLGISSDKKVLVFVGRIVKSKGIKELLNAVEQIHDKSIVLLIIGSTNFGAKDISKFEIDIKKKCEELGNQVRFTGFIHNNELWKYYKISDIAVLPSMWEEPAGLTMIEAAAAGLPVITTISGGIPEYLNNNHAILIERNKSIVENIKNSVYEILSDMDKWKQKGQEASDYVVDNFSESAFYNSFVNVFIKQKL